MLPDIGHSMGLEGKVHKYYKDRVFMNLLKNSLNVSDINPTDYQGLYLTGGHGTCFDFPKSEALAELIRHFYEAICSLSWASWIIKREA